MRKLIAMLLAVLLMMSLAACGAEESNADLMITRAPETATEAADGAAEEMQSAETAAAVVGPFAFAYESVDLTPGKAFDAAALPDADSVYTVPSCALEGTDNVYNYGAFELTAFDEGNGEVIYSIYFLDPDLTTPEGLALGDDAAKAVELYGEGFEQDGNAYVYTCDGIILCVIAQDGVVTSIEYRLDI